MKIGLYPDELWPVYIPQIGNDDYGEYEVPFELIERLGICKTEFDEIQDQFHMIKRNIDDNS